MQGLGQKVRLLFHLLAMSCAFYPAGVADLLRGAAALLGTDHRALSGNGVVDICDPATGADGCVYVEIEDDEC